MKPILVLGIGSRLMMDDGIGVNVVETLAKQTPEDEFVSYEIGETDFEYSLDLMLRAEYLIIIDAAITGKKPGEVSIFLLSELQSVNQGISQHNLHFLDLVNQLDQRKKGVMIGIEPFHIDFHWGLSCELSEIFGTIVGKVEDTIERIKREYIKGKNLLS